MTDSATFDDWFEVTFAQQVDELPPARLDDLRAWAREQYEVHGAITREAVEVLRRLDQIATVESAVALVIADLAVLSERVPVIEVDVYDDGLRITVDGSHVAPSFRLPHPFDVADAAVGVVEYVREQLSQDRTVSFPVCSRHDRCYLHPVLDGGVAVWRCNRGAHVVAQIGRLGQP